MVRVRQNCDSLVNNYVSSSTLFSGVVLQAKLVDPRVVDKWEVPQARSFSCALSKPIPLHSSENKILIKETKVNKI